MRGQALSEAWSGAGPGEHLLALCNPGSGMSNSASSMAAARWYLSGLTRTDHPCLALPAAHKDIDVPPAPTAVDLGRHRAARRGTGCTGYGVARIARTI